MDKSILFVDDEEMVLSSLRRELAEWLEDLGYNMVSATSVDAGLALVRANPGQFRVVVSDLKMPGKLGTVLLGAVASEFPDISTVLLTGFAEIEEIKKAIRSGIISFVQKPWDANLLQAELMRAIELATLKRERRTHVSQLEQEAVWLKRIHHALLLPKPQTDGQLRWGLGYRPARATLDGGGDFFQIRHLSAERVLVCIGSIDAPGAQGTYHAMLVRDELLTLIQDQNPNLTQRPNTILEQLNNRLCTMGLEVPGYFMSMTVAAIDLTRHQLRMSNAGGEQYMDCTKGEWETHHLPSPGIGFKPDLLFSTREHPFHPGDRLLLASPSLMVGADQLHQLEKAAEAVEIARIDNTAAQTVLDQIDSDATRDQTMILCGWKE